MFVFLLQCRPLEEPLVFPGITEEPVLIDIKGAESDFSDSSQDTNEATGPIEGNFRLFPCKIAVSEGEMFSLYLSAARGNKTRPSGLSAGKTGYCLKLTYQSRLLRLLEVSVLEREDRRETVPGVSELDDPVFENNADDGCLTLCGQLSPDRQRALIRIRFMALQAGSTQLLLYREAAEESFSPGNLSTGWKASMTQVEIYPAPSFAAEVKSLKF